MSANAWRKALTRLDEPDKFIKFAAGQCEAFTHAGRWCKNRAKAGSDYCAAHDARADLFDEVLVVPERGEAT